MSTVTEAIQNAAMEAKRMCVIARLEQWIKHAREFDVVETPTTSPCVGEIGNGFSCETPDGGVEIRVKISAFTRGGLKTARVERDVYRVINAPWE